MIEGRGVEQRGRGHDYSTAASSHDSTVSSHGRTVSSHDCLLDGQQPRLGHIGHTLQADDRRRGRASPPRRPVRMDGCATGPASRQPHLQLTAARPTDNTE